MSAHPRFSLNQATVKYASLAEAIDVTKAAGIESIGVWREPVADIGLDAATRLIADSGLRVSSLCRAGFFTTPEGQERMAALDDNRRAIDETAALAAAGAAGSAAVLVLVAGGLPAGSRDLKGARERVRDALGALEPFAASAGVTLAVEALHPMFAADRAVVSTLGQAIDLAVDAGPSVGVVVDTYHVWWDPDVFEQIERAGRLGRIASYQVCDWLTPLPADVLLGRGVPGDGHIDFGGLTRAVEDAGYTGDIECEIFNADVWSRPYAEVACEVSAAFTRVVAPELL
ncbi:sugar phosphate isomerase/epimerase [Planctomonas sp. JC2975]|uniref:sugar phosphate isomerase/epimerase family protein n=1 Tax=Planctomonas sp. JC2975 TaxID=2729626 RepID=UPI00147673C4|nr:sugar phosphate isomerase/epimerase family protein [Planctomonas sp. JC2975]NNC13881.1 sugar phosphate isomerase/epimerase [Planctomonas sp. JC2975]